MVELFAVGLQTAVDVQLLALGRGFTVLAVGPGKLIAWQRILRVQLDGLFQMSGRLFDALQIKQHPPQGQPRFPEIGPQPDSLFIVAQRPLGLRPAVVDFSGPPGGGGVIGVGGQLQLELFERVAGLGRVSSQGQHGFAQAVAQTGASGFFVQGLAVFHDGQVVEPAALVSFAHGLVSPHRIGRRPRDIQRSLHGGFAVRSVGVEQNLRIVRVRGVQLRGHLGGPGMPPQAEVASHQLQAGQAFHSGVVRRMRIAFLQSRQGLVVAPQLRKADRQQHPRGFQVGAQLQSPLKGGSGTVAAPAEEKAEAQLGVDLGGVGQRSRQLGVAVRGVGVTLRGEGALGRLELLELRGGQVGLLPRQRQPSAQQRQDARGSPMESRASAPSCGSGAAVKTRTVSMLA